MEGFGSLCLAIILFVIIGIPWMCGIKYITEGPTYTHEYILEQGYGAYYLDENNRRQFKLHRLCEPKKERLDNESKSATKGKR